MTEKDYDYDKYEKEIIDDDEVIDSSLEIGGQIHQQSDIVQKFTQLPKDVKYSKFGKIDIANFTLKSRTYQLWKYMRKIEKVSSSELVELKYKKKEIYEIETLEEFKEYLEETNKGHIWYNLIHQLPKEELIKSFDLLLKQLQKAKEDGVLESVYADKDNFKNSYKEYLEENTDSPDIDDFGLMSTMMTLTEVNKASGGWATKQMNTTINVTKEENLQNDVEESPEDSEKSFANKFMKK